MSATNKHFSFISILIFVLCLMCASAYGQDTSRPRLGLTVSPMQTSPLLLQHLRLAEGEGIMVDNIAVGSDLETAGLSQGDILLAIDDHPLNNPSDLTKYIANLPTGAKVKLDVIQKGEHGQIFVTLDNLPDKIVWKYVQPITSPGRSGLSQAPKNRQSQSPSGFSGSVQGGANQRSTFTSIVSTPQGIQSSTVTITGDKSDPSSTIEITIGDNTYRSTIGEIDQLPQEARQAAQSAISQSQSFSFSFGGNGDIFDEMMRRQMEHMQQMDEFFQQQFQMPSMPAPARPAPAPDNDPLVPVKPKKDDIRS